MLRIMPIARANSDVGGVAQHRAVSRDHQRPIGSLWRIARDQVNGVVIDVGIEQMMRIAVTAEKSLQAYDAARIRRADQQRAAGAALDQIHPAQDHRAHDALTKIGFGDHKSAQSLRRNQQGLDIAFGFSIDQCDAA